MPSYYRDTSNIDPTTNAIKELSYEHNEVHAGSHFNLEYSVASIGALESPDDTMTLTFTTPNTTKWVHMMVSATSSSGARFRFIEGGTGAGASPTGSLAIYNSNRNISKSSGIFDIATIPTPNQMSYDATLVTGGTSLIDMYIGADGKGNAFIGGTERGSQEWILKQNTQYQLSIYEADTVPGVIQISWYEHTNK